MSGPFCPLCPFELHSAERDGKRKGEERLRKKPAPLPFSVAALASSAAPGTRTQSHFHKFPQVLRQLVPYNSRQTLFYFRALALCPLPPRCLSVSFCFSSTSGARNVASSLISAAFHITTGPPRPVLDLPLSLALYHFFLYLTLDPPVLQTRASTTLASHYSNFKKNALLFGLLTF